MLSIYNDMSFILDLNLNIYEHQSTVCPNMPIRLLNYFMAFMKPMLREHDIYGKKLMKIPVPHFVVFYNGKEEQPEQYIQRLSDAFERSTEEPQLELICKVYNINRGKNKEFLDKCPVLKEYMIFVDYVRGYHKEHKEEGLEAAVAWGIDRCIEENVLRDFLIEHRLEVEKIMELDYTFERRLELQREEGLEEGRDNGIRALLNTLQELKIPVETAIAQVKDKFQLGDIQTEKYMQQYWKGYQRK
jgi:hypothetical protein